MYRQLKLASKPQSGGIVQRVVHADRDGGEREDGADRERVASRLAPPAARPGGTRSEPSWMPSGPLGTVSRRTVPVFGHHLHHHRAAGLALRRRCWSSPPRKIACRRSSGSGRPAARRPGRRGRSRAASARPRGWRCVAYSSRSKLSSPTSARRPRAARASPAGSAACRPSPRAWPGRAGRAPRARSPRTLSQARDLGRRDAVGEQRRRVEPGPLAGSAGSPPSRPARPRRGRCRGSAAVAAGQSVEARRAAGVREQLAQHRDLALQAEPRIALGRQLLCERCHARFDGRRRRGAGSGAARAAGRAARPQPAREHGHARGGPDRAPAPLHPLEQ